MHALRGWLWCHSNACNPFISQHTGVPSAPVRRCTERTEVMVWTPLWEGGLNLGTQVWVVLGSRWCFELWAHMSERSLPGWRRLWKVGPCWEGVLRGWFGWSESTFCQRALAGLSVVEECSQTPGPSPRCTTMPGSYPSSSVNHSELEAGCCFGCDT